MTNLLHNEALKRGVNLSCMREDGRYELQIMSICDGAIFSLRRNRGLLRNHGVFKGVPPTKSRYKLVVRHLK